MSYFAISKHFPEFKERATFSGDLRRTNCFPKKYHFNQFKIIKIDHFQNQIILLFGKKLAD